MPEEGEKRALEQRQADVAEKESPEVLAEQECSQKHEQQRKAATDEMKEEVTHRNVSLPKEGRRGGRGSPDTKW